MTPLGSIERTIDVKSLVISPDQSKFAYAFRKPSKDRMGELLDFTLNNKVLASDFESVEYESILFSLDSSHIAFCGKREDNYYYFQVDNDVSNPSLEKDLPVFSPDSRNVAYRVRDRVNRASFVLNGDKLDHDFSGVMHFSFSPNSHRHAYIGASRVSKELIVMIDEKEQEYIEAIARPGVIFSPDSKSFCYVYRQDEKFFVVFNDTKFGPYKEVSNFPIFSPDSQFIAYTVEENNLTSIYLNDERLLEVMCTGSAGLKFSPDSQKLGFVYRKFNNENWFMELYDIPGKKSFGDGIPYKGIGINSPLFSNDSNHIAWEFQDFNGQWYIQRDGKAGPLLWGISHPTFSNDSRYFLYIMIEDEYEMITVNDHIHKRARARSIGGTGCLFSKNSKHLAFDFKTENGFNLNLDGTEYGPYNAFLKNSSLYFGEHYLRALLIDKHDITKMEINIHGDYNFLVKYDSH